jgi:hypothetical protein
MENIKLNSCVKSETKGENFSSFRSKREKLHRNLCVCLFFPFSGKRMGEGKVKQNRKREKFLRRNEKV